MKTMKQWRPKSSTEHSHALHEIHSRIMINLVDDMRIPGMYLPQADDTDACGTEEWLPTYARLGLTCDCRKGVKKLLQDLVDSL